MITPELDLVQAIFYAVEARENYLFRSLNDYWVEINELTINPEELKRASLEMQGGLPALAVVVNTTLFEIDESVEPANITETPGRWEYRIVVHKEKSGVGVCVHFSSAEALSCEQNRPHENKNSNEDTTNFFPDSDDPPYQHSRMNHSEGLRPRGLSRATQVHWWDGVSSRPNCGSSCSPLGASALGSMV